MDIVAGERMRASSLRIPDLLSGKGRGRFRSVAWSCAVLCAIFSVLPFGGSVAAKEAVAWIESYDEALSEARRTGKPIFLEFRCAP